MSGGSFLSDGSSIGLGNLGSTGCALDGTETAQCWGENSHGEAGNATTTDTGSPAVVQGL